MNFKDFKEYAVAVDSNNIFEECDNVPDVVPEFMKSFYQKFNPVDVEVEIDNAIVRFYPAEQLKRLQQEYSISDVFIFATCNGDPIFIYDGNVYSCAHGSDKSQWELMTNELYNYFMLQEKRVDSDGA